MAVVAVRHGALPPPDRPLARHAGAQRQHAGGPDGRDDRRPADGARLPRQPPRRAALRGHARRGAPRGGRRRGRAQPVPGALLQGARSRGEGLPRARSGERQLHPGCGRRDEALQRGQGLRPQDEPRQRVPGTAPRGGVRRRDRGRVPGGGLRRRGRGELPRAPPCRRRGPHHRLQPDARSPGVGRARPGARRAHGARRAPAREADLERARERDAHPRRPWSVDRSRARLPGRRRGGDGDEQRLVQLHRREGTGPAARLEAARPLPRARAPEAGAHAGPAPGYQAPRSAIKRSRRVATRSGAWAVASTPCPGRSSPGSTRTTRASRPSRPRRSARSCSRRRWGATIPSST